MKHSRWGLALAAMGMVAALLGGAAPAQASTCAALRQSIVDMDAKAAKPPGYALLRQELLAKAAACSDVPSPDPVDVSHCASSGNESMCTLLTQAGASCRRPQRESRRVCEMLFGPDYENDGNRRGSRIDQVMPATLITLDGGTYQLNAECASALFDLSELDDSNARTNGLRGGLRDRHLSTMKQSCPDFVAALEQRIGRSATTDMANFWPAFGELVMSNFAPRGTPPMSVRSFQNDTGFQNACLQARNNRDICLQRQGNMGPVGQESRGKAGQAGAFGQCAALYGAFARMCGATDQAAAREASRPQPPTARAPAPVTAPPTVNVPAPVTGPPTANAPAPGTAPPTVNAPTPRTAPPTVNVPALQALSPACRSQLNQALEAADRGDSARATAVYEAMRSSGCENALRGLATEVEMGLPERQMGRLSRNYFDPNCQNSAAGCGRAPSTPEESARAAANAFYPEQVMQLFLGVGGLAVTSAGYYTPMAGGQMMSSNRFSTVNQRARSTYGQGAPVYSTPRQAPSTITGGGR